MKSYSIVTLGNSKYDPRQNNVKWTTLLPSLSATLIINNIFIKQSNHVHKCGKTNTFSMSALVHVHRKAIFINIH